MISLNRRLAGAIVALCLVVCLGIRSPSLAVEAPDYALAPEEIAPGIYVFWGAQEDVLPHNGGNIANDGFIVGDEAVLVIDTGTTRYYAEQMLAAIEAVTPLPIAGVIVTHHHQDHSFGIPVFVERGHDVYMHPHAAELLERDGAVLLGFMTEFAGEAWTAGTTIGAPTHPVTESFSVDLGGRVIEVIVFEGGHTPGDMMAYDSTTKTLFAGDLVFEGRVPTVPHGDIQTWREQLESIKKLEWQQLVPGHGVLVTDRSVMDGMSAYLAYLESRVACAYRVGDSPAEVLIEPVAPPHDQLYGVQREFQRAVLRLYRQYDDGAPPACK